MTRVDTLLGSWLYRIRRNNFVEPEWPRAKYVKPTNGVMMEKEDVQVLSRKKNIVPY